MSRKPALRFLLADDDRVFSKYFAEWLQGLGPYTVDVVATAGEALEKISEHPYDGVIIDYALAGPLDGMALLKQVKKEHHDLPVVMITGMDRSIGRQALREGAFWYLEKPIDYTEAEVVFRYLGERKRLIRDFQRLWRKKGKKSKRGESPKQRTEQADEEALASAALAALSQALLSAPTLEDLLRIVTQKAPAFLSAGAVAVGLLDLTTGQLASEQGVEELQLPPHITAQGIAQGLLADLWAHKGQGNPTWTYTEPQGGKRWQAHLCFAPRPQPFGSPDTAETMQDAAAPQPLAVVWAVGKESAAEEERLRFEAGLPVVARLLGAAVDQHRQRALFKAVGEAAEKLLAARTRGAVYDAVRSALEEAFEAATYYLAEYDAITDKITFPLFVDLKKHKKAPPPRQASSKEKSGATGYIIRSGQAWQCLRWGAADPCPPLPDGASIQVREPVPRVFLGIPLVAQGETLGVLSVQRYPPIPFGQGQQEALTTLAALIGLALARRRQEEAHRAFLESVFEKPLRDVLAEIAGRVKRALHADIVTLHVYDAQRDVFLPERARLGLSAEEATRPYCGTENDALEKLLKLPPKEHFAEDASQDPVFQGDFVQTYHVRSSGGVVLTLTPAGKAQAVGVLVVNYTAQHHHFTEEEKNLLRALGQEAAMAVGVALMAARERLARERWQLHGKIAQAIRSVLQESQGGAAATRQQNLEERLAEEVTRLLKEGWPTTGCGEVTPSILYADYGARRLRFPDSVWEMYRQGSQTTPPREIPFGVGICGWVAEHKRPYYAPDTANDEHYLPMRPDTRVEIGVPILLGDRLLGVLTVEATLPRFFEEEDRVFLERVAQDLATALGAWGDQQRAQKILEVTASISNQPDSGLKMLVKTAFDLVNNPPGAVSAVSLFSRDEDALKLAALYPPPQARQAQPQKRRRFPLQTLAGERRGIVVRAALEKSTVTALDVSRAPDYVPCHEDTKAEMAVPVLWPTGEVVGVFNVEYRDPTAMDFYDQQVLESLASQMAVALMLREQARTLQQEARQRRLAAALAALGIAAADYGHQWKNELAAFRGTLGLLEEETLPFCRKLKERKGGVTLRLAHRLGVVPDLEKICRWLDRIQALFSEQRPAFPPPDEDLESIAVGPWLEGIVTRWQQRLEKMGSPVTLQLEGAPDKAVVRANRLWLTRAVDNLLSNAARAAAQAAEKEGRNPRVTLTSNATGGSVFLKIADNGTGIPAAVQPYLFDDRVPAEAAPRGHGTGALIAAFVAQFYGGKVQIERTGPEGTIIVLTLPLSTDGKNLHEA